MQGFTLTSAADAGSTSPVTYQWFENGSAINNSDNASLSVSEGKAAGTYAYVRKVSNAACTEVSSNTFTVTVVEVPDAPTFPSSNARCCSGTVTFSATVPTGSTIDWYDAPTGGSIVSGGSGVLLLTANLTSTTTYYAQASNYSSVCMPPARLPVTSKVNHCSPTGAISEPCGCVTPAADCNGTCATSCGNYAACPTIREISANGLEASYAMSYVTCVNLCGSKGNSWRIPTLDEASCICQNQYTAPATGITAGIHARVNDKPNLPASINGTCALGVKVAAAICDAYACDEISYLPVKY